MSDDAERFRQRAIECRALAMSASSAADAALLEEMADDLDAEARRIEREAADGDRPA